MRLLPCLRMGSLRCKTSPSKALLAISVTIGIHRTAANPIDIHPRSSNMARQKVRPLSPFKTKNGGHADERENALNSSLLTRFHELDLVTVSFPRSQFWLPSANFGDFQNR
jgi:hypothetical protein